MTLGCAPAKVELVMCTADGITSQPYSTSSIITLCSFAKSPPARSWRDAICSYTAESSAPVPQVKSPIRSLPIASASLQSTPSILATASRASSAADAGSV